MDRADRVRIEMPASERAAAEAQIRMCAHEQVDASRDSAQAHGELVKSTRSPRSGRVFDD